MGIKIFDLVTLTLKFDLLLKNFKLGHSFLSTNIFNQVMLTLKFDLLMENFNPGHNFRTRRGRVFIFHMCIPSDKTLQTVP